MSQSPSMKRIVAKIRRSLKRRETRVIPQREWSGAKEADYENETVTVDRIATAARCDWLLEKATGDARFFEGN